MQPLMQPRVSVPNRRLIALPIRLISLILVILFMPSSSPQCEALYPRLMFGPQISAELLQVQIMFNTGQSCPSSYVTVSFSSSIFKMQCTQRRIETFDDSNHSQFVHYVQTCPVSIPIPPEVTSFFYFPFASRTNLQTQQQVIIHGSNRRIITANNGLTFSMFQVILIKDDKPLKLVMISDWGPIYNRPYKPLNDTLDYILRERDNASSDAYRVNGLFLNGDYAYDLETQSGKYYLDFLNELSRVSRFWPMFLSIGNHESMRPKSRYLLENSFYLGGQVGATRVQQFHFLKRAQIILFDPYLQIYNRTNPAAREAMIEAIKAGVQSGIKKEFMMVGAHYPLICSQVDPHCRDAMGSMPDLYDWLSRQQRVDLYLGSHMHQYERIYPFINNAFVKKQSPYNRGECVSIVEAVGGVNYFIIENYYPPQYFSAYATYNQTGLGIMTINGQSKDNNYSILYNHYSTVGTYTLLDTMVIGSNYSKQAHIFSNQ